MHSRGLGPSPFSWIKTIQYESFLGMVYFSHARFKDFGYFFIAILRKEWWNNEETYVITYATKQA